MRRLGLHVAALAAASLLSVPATAMPAGTPWTLRHPADPVAFHGTRAPGQADGAQLNMLYPAPNLAGMLAAVLTHAALNEGARQQRTLAAQQEADRVLEPLQQEVQALSHAELMQLALQAIPDHGAVAVGTTGPGTPGWQVSSAPVFYLAQDRRTLILDNTIGIFPPGEAAKPAYATTVRVISGDHPEEDPIPGWKEHLKSESARLLAHSLVLALRDARRTAAATEPMRSMRYLQGETEKVERAHPVETWCQRQVMRTLRGWLLSAPVRPQEGAAACNPGELVRN